MGGMRATGTAKSRARPYKAEPVMYRFILYYNGKKIYERTGKNIKEVEVELKREAYNWGIAKSEFSRYMVEFINTHKGRINTTNLVTHKAQGALTLYSFNIEGRNGRNTIALSEKFFIEEVPIWNF